MIVLSNKRNKNSLMGENMALSNIRAYLLKNDVAEDICKEKAEDY